MIKRGALFILIYSILLFIIPFIYAVPPITTTQQFTTGYSIQIPQDNVLQVRQNYTFEFHVNNISNGRPIINNIGCYFHLYDELGQHIFEGYDDIPTQSFDYSFYIDGANFSKFESYYYYIDCNSSALGGQSESILRITPRGEELDTGKSVMFILFFFSSLFLFLLTLYGAIKIPFHNTRNEDNETIGINDLKYVKIILICFSYIILLFMMGILRGVMTYEKDVVIGNLFNWAYWILFYSLWPLIVSSLVFALIIYLSDKKLKEMIKRGGHLG